MRMIQFVALCALALMVSSCSGIGSNMNLAVPPAMQNLLRDFDRATLSTLVSENEVEETGLSKAEIDALPRYGEGLAAEYRILAQAELDQVSEAQPMIDSFIKAVNAGERVAVACFFPHHALRLEKDGRKLDILICFMCHNYMVLPSGGYNNVHMSKAQAMESTWRAVVRKHGLRDISDKS